MLREFLHLYIKEYRRIPTAVGICIVTLTVALLEGLNISLLVPLLESLASPGQEGSHWVTRTIDRIFTSVGVPLELGTILLALAALILVTVGLKYLRMRLVAAAERDLTIWMRSRYMHNLLRADISYFHRERLGVLTASLSMHARPAGQCLILLTDIITTAAVALALLGTAFLLPYLDPAFLSRILCTT